MDGRDRGRPAFALIPQVVFWVAYTVAVGMVAGALVAAWGGIPKEDR